MSDHRTHGADSAIDDDLPDQPPPRVIVGPYQMRHAGAVVSLSFVNAQYAQIFVERHRCQSINALQSGWDYYRYGKSDTPINCPLCSAPPVVISESDISSSKPSDHYERAVTITCDQCGISLTEEYYSEVVAKWNARAPDVPKHRESDNG